VNKQSAEIATSGLWNIRRQQAAWLFQKMSYDRLFLSNNSSCEKICVRTAHFYLTGPNRAYIRPSAVSHIKLQYNKK